MAFFGVIPGRCDSIENPALTEGAPKAVTLPSPQIAVAVEPDREIVTGAAGVPISVQRMRLASVLVHM